MFGVSWNLISGVGLCIELLDSDDIGDPDVIWGIGLDLLIFRIAIVFFHPPPTGTT